MTDLSTPPEPNAPSGTLAHDDRMIAGIVYVLFLIWPTFLPVVIGLVLAYSNRETQSAMLRSHYLFQIRTFWICFALAVIALSLLVIGIPLSLLLIGIPAVILSVAILCGLGLLFALRCIVGLVYLAQSKPYPRPQTWLI